MKTIDYKNFVKSFQIDVRLILMLLGADAGIQSNNALPVDKALLLISYDFLKTAGFDENKLILFFRDILDDFKNTTSSLIVLDNRFISTADRVKVFDMETQDWVDIIDNPMFITMLSFQAIFDRLIKHLIID